MTLLDTPLDRLDGSPATLGELTGNQVALVVNVASRCGLTPQYATLEKLHETYADRGFTVVGVPCNQFGGQEPGGPDEIAQFCSSTYGVTFPMAAKVDVNGPTRHQVYDMLTSAADPDGEAGDVHQWTFEKFLLSTDGTVVARFRPGVQPDDSTVIDAIERQLG